MPAYARREVVREGEVGLYHCVARCVRRAFLCGDDPLTGKSCEHRKDWVEERLEFLAGIFAVEVCGYAVMSNHLHVVLRLRPDLAAGWSDEEVARRWWRLFPHRRDAQGQPAEPEPHELAMLVAEPQAAAARRMRLANLSWFMRCLCEPIARRANREDGCTGRFWEGRFKSVALLDEAAVLACTIYVDLNPVRAQVAETPEQSEHTSACQRIRGRRERSAVQAPDEPDADGWLCPIEAERPAEQAVAVAPASLAEAGSPRRPSSESFLPMSLDDYLRLLDWTGRQLHSDKQGQIPLSLAPILDRLGLEDSAWLDCVTNFGRWFHRAASRLDHLLAEATRRGRHHLHGLSHSRMAFV